MDSLLDIWEIAFQRKLAMTSIKILLLGRMFEVQILQILHRNELRLLKVQRQGNDSLIRTVHKSYEGTVKVQWIIKVGQKIHKIMTIFFGGKYL